MQSALQRLEGFARKAIQTYGMISPHDSICVAVSGGKDSVALAAVLQNLSRYHEHPFSVQALILDPCFEGKETDYSLIQKQFETLQIPLHIKRTNIGQIVFETRKEQNPCALCANLRRGSLHNAAKELGCNSIALGHHLDDAVETFYMNLFNGGRIACFSPKTWLSRKEITMIRPLVFALEQDVIKAVNGAKLPVVRNHCPIDGFTQRATAKEFVAQRCRQDAAFRQKTLGAMQQAGIDGWGPVG